MSLGDLLQEGFTVTDHIIISKAHTRKGDPFILLWAPEDRGYRYRKEAVGLYSEAAVRQAPRYYNNNDETIAVKASDLDGLWVRSEDVNPRYLDQQGLVLPNTKEVWARIRKHRSKYRPPKRVTP